MSFDGYLQIIFTTIIPAIIAIVVEIIHGDQRVKKKYIIITIGIWFLITIIVTIIYLYPKFIEKERDTYGNLSDSKAELLVKQNLDLIRQLKDRYSDSDCVLVYNDYVELLFYEKAGCIYQDLAKEGKSYELAGRHMSVNKVVIVDYFSDEIICTYTPESNSVKHSPNSQKEFYCVIFDYEHNIYVSHPISVVGGEWYCDVKIIIDKKGTEYTPLFQIYPYIQDAKSSDPYPVDPSAYMIRFECLVSGVDFGIVYDANIIDSGILSKSKKYTYFSLNTNYELYFHLNRIQDDNTEYLTKQVLDEFITNSNFIEVVFNIEDINK